jgi:hypothetical protein
MWKKYGRAGQVTDDDIIQHRNDAKIHSTYCLSTAPVVVEMYLNVMCDFRLPPRSR